MRMSTRTWSRSIAIVGILALAGLGSGSAWAQATPEKKPADAAGKPPAAPAGGEADMMKPAPELQQYKSMIGNWKCDGNASMGGQKIKTTGTYKAQWDLDNHFVVAHFEGKAAGMPGTHKGTDVYGYDPASKQYVQYGFDSFGMISKATSKGWEGDKQEWTGTATAMGKEAP